MITPHPRVAGRKLTSVDPQVSWQISMLHMCSTSRTAGYELLLATDPTHSMDRPQEKEIIEHTHSCYVLGRSGTGWGLSFSPLYVHISDTDMQQNDNNAIQDARD
jgi:hypothetical protein